MKRTLDHTDKLILSELTLNSKQSHSQIADKVNLSRNAVRQRIERLERDGIIQGYTIVRRDPNAESEGNISAIIFVYRHDRMRGTDVIDALMKIPEVTQCEVISGEFDLLVRVETTSTEQIDQIWSQISLMPGVENTLTSFVLSSYT